MKKRYILVVSMLCLMLFSSVCFAEEYDIVGFDDSQLKTYWYLDDNHMIFTSNSIISVIDGSITCVENIDSYSYLQDNVWELWATQTSFGTVHSPVLSNFDIPIGDGNFFLKPQLLAVMEALGKMEIQLEMLTPTRQAGWAIFGGILSFLGLKKAYSVVVVLLRKA